MITLIIHLVNHNQVPAFEEYRATLYSSVMPRLKEELLDFECVLIDRGRLAPLGRYAITGVVSRVIWSGDGREITLEVLCTMNPRCLESKHGPVSP